MMIKDDHLVSSEVRLAREEVVVAWPFVHVVFWPGKYIFGLSMQYFGLEKNIFGLCMWYVGLENMLLVCVHNILAIGL